MTSSSRSQLGVEKRLATFRREVDREIYNVTRHKRGAEWIAEEALRYSMLTKGHRWRPLLFLALIEAMQGSYKKYLYAAAGLEMIHTGTLIIDDLPFVDNATLRRNKPCCHIRFGVDVASYASHLAFDLAESLILSDAPTDLRERIFKEIKKLKETLISGQCIERAFNSGKLSVTQDNIKKQYYLKSGALFKFSAQLAAILSGVPPKNVQFIGNFAEEAGVAYQIADDIADLAGKPSEIGKSVNMDRGKANFPRHFGKQLAIKKLNEYNSRAVSTLKKLFENRVLSKNEALIICILNNIHRHY